MNDALPRNAPPPNMAPIDFETEVGPLPLKGAIPDGLRGTLVRNGPNPVMPDPKEHWFAGDGMLHAFSIDDGKNGAEIRYRNRWVRTQRWQAAAKARTCPAASRKRPRTGSSATTARPTPTSSAMPATCWRSRRRTCRWKWRCPRSTRSAPTTSRVACRAPSPRTPRPIRRPASCCSSATARRRRCRTA